MGIENPSPMWVGFRGSSKQKSYWDDEEWPKKGVILMLLMDGLFLGSPSGND